jgi:hypothetical protein
MVNCADDFSVIGVKSIIKSVTRTFESYLG